MDELDTLRELAAQLPRYLHSDWLDTNHYELTIRDAESEEYWWLMVAAGLRDNSVNWCETEEGKRFGLIMDIAEEVGRLRDAGVL